MQKILVKDSKLKEILTARGETFGKIAELNKKIEVLDKERNKEGHKMNRLKEKTQPIVDKLTPTFKLGEFDIISKVFIEKEQCFVEIVNLVEEYKKALREKKQNDNSSNSDNK